MILPEIRFELPKDKLANCVWCNWRGKIRDCTKKYVNSPPADWKMLAGKEGYEYYCPKCKAMVDDYYWRIS